MSRPPSFSVDRDPCLRAVTHDTTGLQSPVLEHIELMKDLLRSGQLPKPSKDHAQHRTGLPEMLDTPNCSQMVTCIHGSFKEPTVAPLGTPGMSQR